jgi:hypothetical protein
LPKSDLNKKTKLDNDKTRYRSVYFESEEERHGQQTIEYVQSGSLKSAFNSSRLPCSKRKRRTSSRDVRPDSKGNARLWHLRLGHPGPMSLHHLGINALGVKLQGPKTTECQHCSLAKIKRQVSRRFSERNIDKPYLDLHIDWTNLKEAPRHYIRAFSATPKLRTVPPNAQGV